MYVYSLLETTYMLRWYLLEVKLLSSVILAGRYYFEYLLSEYQSIKSVEYHSWPIPFIISTLINVPLTLQTWKDGDGGVTEIVYTDAVSRWEYWYSFSASTINLLSYIIILSYNHCRGQN